MEVNRIEINQDQETKEVFWVWLSSNMRKVKYVSEKIPGKNISSILNDSKSVVHSSHKVEYKYFLKKIPHKVWDIKYRISKEKI